MTRDSWQVLALKLGLIVPLLYFGIQPLAAPFFAGYDFLRMATSLLGSDSSSFPLLFNVGAVLCGIVTLIAALGFYRAALVSGAAPWLVWLTVAALVGCGLSSLWAGIFPLPDSRHAANPFTPALLSLPLLVAATLWKYRRFRVYLVLPVVVLLLLVPFMSGATGLDLRAFAGLLQRVLALAVFSSVALGAGLLLRARVRLE